jgi:cytochrome P450
MSHFCPHYPKPAPQRPSFWRMFFSKRHSWLDGLYERSYTMKMGEVHLPGVDLYMINEPAWVRQVLVEDAAHFPKNDRLGDALRPLLGDSIFTTHGAVWQRQRELMNPSFDAARVHHVMSRMVDATQALLDRLRRVPEGAEHDMEVEMTHVAADIILRTILSQPLDGPAARQIFMAFERYQALAPRLMMPALFGLRWLRPWWLERRSRQAAAEIRNLLVGLIQPRFEAARRAASVAAADASPQDDILASLLRARDPDTGEGFGFEELVDQVAMLFLAGHETSASALSWTLHLLAQAPDVQERLHGEAAHALAQGPLNGPGDIKDLVLTRNVFREALRLFPPVGFLARQSAQACTLRDKPVPAGASVVVSPWLIQRHRELWARPDEFDPDRYGQDAEQSPDTPSAKQSLRQAYLPFGMGPRVCIGAAFALQEASLVLAMVAQRYRFEPVPGHVPQPVGRLTIRSANGIRLRVFTRQSAP